MSKCNKAPGCLALHNAWIVFRHSPSHKPEAWISFLINNPTPEKHGGACIFRFYLFFLMGAGWRERGWGIFISWPPLSSPVKHTSISSSKNKNCDPYPWHEGEIDVPNQSRGSWNLFFKALFCFNIVQYSRVTATNTFISQTQFCGFSPLFFIRYRYHQIFFIQGRKR